MSDMWQLWLNLVKYPELDVTCYIRNTDNISIHSQYVQTHEIGTLIV